MCSGLAMAGWLLVLVAPRWRGSQVAAGALIVRYMPGAAGGFDSLPAVATLFQHPGLLLAGWAHYLAFDLFIG